jgi:hypothetical protein
MPIMPDLPESDKTNIAVYVLEGRLKACGYLRIGVEIPGASAHSALLGTSTDFLARLCFIRHRNIDGGGFRRYGR